MSKGRCFSGWIVAAAVSLTGGVFAPDARADDAAGFPSRSIRVVVPFAPGGAADILARTAVQAASMETGWQFHVENITGAGGLVGAQAGARGAPDGYTLLLCNVACATSQFLVQGTDWNPTTAITPVMVVGYMPNVLVVGRSIGVETFKDFIDRARAQPGRASIATSGRGSTSSMAADLLATNASIRTLEIAYRGSAAAIPDLISGRVDGMIMGLPESLSFVRDGTLKALGVTSAERTASLPDVPTIAEAGVAGYKFVGWLSLFAPKNTPVAVVDKLNGALNRAIASPALLKRFAELSIQPAGGTPELAGQLLKEDIELWEPILCNKRAPD